MKNKALIIGTVLVVVVVVVIVIMKNKKKDNILTKEQPSSVPTCKEGWVYDKNLGECIELAEEVEIFETAEEV